MRRCVRPGVGGVVDHVAARHRVDGDEQVGVDGQARRVAQLAAGVDLRAGGEVDRRQQRVEPAARRQRRSEIVVDQPHGRRCTGRAWRQPWLVRQRPEHGQPNGFGGVGRHHRRQRVGGGVGRGFGWHTEHRKQEAGVVEAGGFTVVGGAVDIDHHRVHAWLRNVKRRQLRRPQRIGESERNGLSARQFRRKGDEVGDGLVLVDVAAEVGAQTGRRRDSSGVLEAHHHIADGSVTDVEDRSGDRDDRLAGGGDHLGGDAVDADLQERRRTRFARGGVGTPSRSGDEEQR